MEKFGGFVPENKKAEFNRAAQDGKDSMEYSEQKKSRAAEETAKFKKKAKIAAGVGVLGVASSPLTGVIGPAAGGMMAGLILGEANEHRKDAKKYSETADFTRKEGEESYDKSRKIVTDEIMKDKEAGYKDTDSEGNISLRLTEEQIEAARKEMNKDLDSRK